MRLTPPLKQVLVRELIGESLREERMAQAKTLREVSQSARVSLGYLSEVERGQKEASSELLAAICSALDVPLSVILNLVSEKMAAHEQLHRAGRRPADHPRHGGPGRRLTDRRIARTPGASLGLAGLASARRGAGRSRSPDGVITKPASCRLVLTAAEPNTCWPSARSTVSRPELSQPDGASQGVGRRGQDLGDRR